MKTFRKYLKKHGATSWALFMADALERGETVAYYPINQNKEWILEKLREYRALK